MENDPKPGPYTGVHSGHEMHGPGDPVAPQTENANRHVAPLPPITPQTLVNESSKSASVPPILSKTEAGFSWD